MPPLIAPFGGQKKRAVQSSRSRKGAEVNQLAKEGHVQVPGGEVWFKIVGSGDAVPLLDASRWARRRT